MPVLSCTHLQQGADTVLCRPLVVGDRVTLAGGVQLTGVVEQIDFTRTIIRNDVDIPVSVPNKVRPYPIFKDPPWHMAHAL